MDDPLLLIESRAGNRFLINRFLAFATVWTRTQSLSTPRGDSLPSSARSSSVNALSVQAADMSRSGLGAAAHERRHPAALRFPFREVAGTVCDQPRRNRFTVSRVPGSSEAHTAELQSRGQ